MESELSILLLCQLLLDLYIISACTAVMFNQSSFLILQVSWGIVFNI